LKPTFVYFVLWITAVVPVFGQPGPCELIPRPLQCAEKPGKFLITSETRIFSPPGLAEAAGLLAEHLVPGETRLTGNKRDATITLELAGADSGIGDEGYRLVVTPTNVNIAASSTQGAIHAVFTFLQIRLLQPDMSAIPCCEISDSPRFGYRGLHLDVSRHFYPVSFIKKYIDLMALYKFNNLHLHLTDGPGWRLQIRRYPELTSRAAFRTHRIWQEWWNSGRKYSEEGNPGAYGGYYTQDDARAIVAYASRRGINVIPEIEMPGHSEEVLAVYPELSCSGKPYESGEFCIGNPGTYAFLENVLLEVMEIFPSEYIHIGGDEASVHHWKQCPKCQALKQEKGLADEHELQAWLIRHMEKFLKSHGRKLLGWDEIVDGGLPDDATVMSWRGTEGGIKAMKQGNDVIMTPASETYLDFYQSDPATQPKAIGGYLTLDRIYNFEPVPDGLTTAEEKRMLGTQANVWTEYMPNTDHVEYMAYPRAIALSEVAWSRKEDRNYDDFHRRLQPHYRLLQRKNVNYYRPSSAVTVIAWPDYDKKQNLISFQTEQYRPEIRFTLDGSDPVATSALYTKPFHSAGQTVVKAAIFSNGKPAGGITSYTAQYHRAIGKKVTYLKPWSDGYPARREQTLTNGVQGSLSYQDNEWLGLLSDLDVVIDMETTEPLSSLTVRFMIQPGPGVFLPSHVEVLLSDNGEVFKSAGKQTHDIQHDNVLVDFKIFRFNFENAGARFIRVKAPNVMKGFMFVDEIIVY
jgi:hexosaminidase